MSGCVAREVRRPGSGVEPGRPWSSLLSGRSRREWPARRPPACRAPRRASRVPEIAALTWVEWTLRSFAYSGRFQKSFRRGTDSVNTLLYGCASRNSGEFRTSLRAGTPPSCAHFFWASGVWNHLMKFSASACFSAGMYFETCRPMPPSGTLSVSCLGSGAKASFSRISSLVLPSLEVAGSSRPPMAAIHWKPTQTLPCDDRGVDLVDEPVARALRRERHHLVDEHVHRLLAGGVVDDALDLAVVLVPQLAAVERVHDVVGHGRGVAGAGLVEREAAHAGVVLLALLGGGDHVLPRGGRRVAHQVLAPDHRPRVAEQRQAVGLGVRVGLAGRVLRVLAVRREEVRVVLRRVDVLLDEVRQVEDRPVGRPPRRCSASRGSACRSSSCARRTG